MISRSECGDSGHNPEQLRGINQSRAISDIITQGFDEYYFVMSNFEDPKLIDSTESLLQSAENLDQGLKMIIICFHHLKEALMEIMIGKAGLNILILSSRGIPTPLKDLLSMISIGLVLEMMQNLNITLILWNILI